MTNVRQFDALMSQMIRYQMCLLRVFQRATGHISMADAFKPQENGYALHLISRQTCPHAHISASPIQAIAKHMSSTAMPLLIQSRTKTARQTKRSHTHPAESAKKEEKQNTPS